MKYLLLFYMGLPCFVANMIPLVAAKYGWLTELNQPLDFGKKVFGKRIFGDHKTWRGFVVGIAAAVLISLLQYFLERGGIISFPRLSGVHEFLRFGFLAGFGALLGDAVESFVKRQLRIKSGEPLIPLDQTDYIFGFLIFTSFLVSWTPAEVFFFLLCGVFLNPLVNAIAYFLKIKKTYW